MQLVECVPNFSEGRNHKVIETIVSSIKSVNHVALLDKESDQNHNRSVITFAGPPQAVKQAAFQATQTASELIDLTKHRGEHPRMGATDVIPFVPLRGVTMPDCVNLAQELGYEISEKLNIPVYLYEEAATRPDRKNLANIRKGEFEGLRNGMGKNPDRKPDLGPERIHPTAGATMVGARWFLIAYNINLATPDLKIARQIARIIRESSGGFPCVKALGLKSEISNQQSEIRKIAQVSMNLTNYKVTSMKTVFEAVKKEADKLGTKILESELIGLLPQDALKDTTPQELLLTDFKPSQIIENRIKEFFE